MRITEMCVNCLYEKQQERTDNKEYLAEIKDILENRGENATSPYLIYLFDKVHRKYFGCGMDYTAIKKEYNDLVLGIEDKLRNEIIKAKDPLAKAIVMARIGNYIDFGAMNNVDTNEFISLFENTDMSENDFKTYDSFLKECSGAKSFLLITDNCGEVVLDRLMLEQLKNRFPNLVIRALVRGGDVLNDATEADAKYVHLDDVAEIVSSGAATAGTIYEMISDEARNVLDNSDVILAKGQGNYESLAGQGRHIFFEFLCKCDLFTTRFNVPRLTGMFVEEKIEQKEI